MKPVCKSEARWYFWRPDRPWTKNVKGGFDRFAKKYMNRVRRRYYKRLIDKGE